MWWPFVVNLMWILPWILRAADDYATVYAAPRAPGARRASAARK